MNFFNLNRRSYFSRLAAISLLVIDLMVITAALFLAERLFYPIHSIANQEIVSFFVLLCLSWIVTSFYTGVYHISYLFRFSDLALSSLLSLVTSMLIVSIYAFLLSSGLFDVAFLAALSLMIYAGLMLVKVIETKWLEIPESLKVVKKNSVIIGHTQAGKKLQYFFQNEVHHQYNFLGFFDDHKDTTEVKGKLKDIRQFCLQQKVDEIFYTLPNHSKLINDLADFAGQNYLDFNLVQESEGMSGNKTGTQIYADGRFPIVMPRRDPLRLFFNQQVKRAFDIFFSSMVILFLFPFIVPVVALAIRIDSKGPVFFRQLRSGKNGRPFWCYKFRTMTVNGDSDKKQATQNDPRITKVGAFLRKSSLDEFPQFYNVLIGDMSVVGPRPHMLKHTEEYSAIIDEFKVRHFINSGITGYAQVNGYRGETKDNSLMEKRVECDNWYLENWSLRLDIKIIFLTVINAIRGEKNAY